MNPYQWCSIWETLQVLRDWVNATAKPGSTGPTSWFICPRFSPSNELIILLWIKNKKSGFAGYAKRVLLTLQTVEGKLQYGSSGSLAYRTLQEPHDKGLVTNLFWNNDLWSDTLCTRFAERGVNPRVTFCWACGFKPRTSSAGVCVDRSLQQSFVLGTLTADILKLGFDSFYSTWFILTMLMCFTKGVSITMPLITL